jgi:hypothetical protein
MPQQRSGGATTTTETTKRLEGEPVLQQALAPVPIETLVHLQASIRFFTPISA